MGMRGEPVVGWHTRKDPSGHYFNLSYLETFKYGTSTLHGFKADCPILSTQIKSRQILLIGLVAAWDHAKAFRKAGVETAQIIVDDMGRHFSILPLRELQKLTSSYELCFVEWPEAAQPNDVELLGDWDYYRIFDEPWKDADFQTPLSFLRQIGSTLLYFWYDGRDRHLLEPEPRVTLELLRADLRACAKLSNPGLALELEDRQLLGLMEPEGSYMSTSPRHITIEQDVTKMMVWRNGPNDRSMYREYVFRNGEVEAVDEWESAATPAEFIKRGWFGSPSCLITLVIAFVLLWLVCRYVF